MPINKYLYYSTLVCKNLKIDSTDLGESFGSVWILTSGGKGLLCNTPSENVRAEKQINISC